jgi:hypothetical protein
MLLTLDTLVDFFAMNGDIFGCADADAHLVGLDAKDGHGDIVADHESLTNSSCQFQHGTSLSHHWDAAAASRTFTATRPAGVVRRILRKSEYRVNAKAKNL